MAWDYYRADVTDGGWAAGNFTSAEVPIDDDDVMIPKEVQNAIAGTDQKGIKLGTLWIAKGYRFGIGTSGSPLIIDAAKFVHEGDGTVYLKSDDTSEPPGAEWTDDVIINSPNGTLAAYLDGEMMDKVTVLAGAVTMASTLGATTKTSRVIVGSTGTRYAANLTIDCQLVAATGTLIQYSGKVTASNVVPIVYQYGGEYRQTDGTGMTVFLGGGTYYYNVSNADADELTAAYLLPGSTFDCTEDDKVKKIAAMYRWPGSVFKRDPDLVTVTADYPMGGGGIIQGPGVQQAPGQLPFGGVGRIQV